MQILYSSGVTISACSPPQHSAWSNSITKLIPITPPARRVSLLGPLSVCSISLSLVRTGTPVLGAAVLDVLLHPSASLSQQLKSFVPAEENGSIHPETSHQHPRLLGHPIKLCMGGLYLFPLAFPLTRPPLLPVTSFPTILLADIVITALSDLLCLGRLVLFDRYLSSVVLPHLSGRLSCSCPSSLAWTFFVCLASPASHRGSVPIRGRARDALVASCCASVG